MRAWGVSVIRALAIANAAFVIGGLYLLADALRRDYELGRLTPPETYYTQVFYMESLLNIGFLAVLAVASVGIWRLRPSGRWLCNAVFVGEILYWVSTTAIVMAILYCGGVLGLLGQALAATGGTGNMGIAPQVFTGYPVIALLILNLAFPGSENDSASAAAPTTRWRGLAQRAGVLLGVIIGMFLFANGIRTLLFRGANGWFEVTVWFLMVLAMLSFLPLSILGIFRPRAAAYGIAAAFVLLLAANLGAIVCGMVKADWSLHSVAHTVLLNILPPCAVATLLFYASASGALESRKHF